MVTTMISALHRKLLRDLWQMKTQCLAICLVMASGVATFVMSQSALKSLETTRSTYYERYRFADVFTRLKRAPNALAARIAEIPGVARVQTRVVVDVTLNVPGLAEPAIGRLISVAERSSPGLNDLHLRQGRSIEPGRRGEALVSEAFAIANSLTLGDRLEAVINGRKQDLTIVGIALSPEYVYSIRPGEFIPDAHSFGVFWMGATDLSAAFDMQGAFNDVALALGLDASEAEVLRQLDRLTEPYGGLGAYARTEQISNKFLANEMSQLRATALIAPLIFLSVASFLLNVVLSRLIATQREQIAALKAFGYTRFEIGRHYLEFVLILVVIGVTLGSAVGAWLGQAVTVLYADFFHFPVFYYFLDADVVLTALGFTGLASVLGTFGAVRAAMLLPPAEAMRPEPPTNFRATVLERLGLGRLLSPPLLMILRKLERKPRQAGLSCLGIAFAISVLILGNFTMDAVDYMIDFQFFASQRQDVTVTFVEPTSSRAVHDLRHLPGVRHVEPFRSVPVRVRFGHMSRRLGIMGLPSEPHLFRLLDARHQPVTMPADGVVMSAKLGEILGCRLGDRVDVEILEGERPTRETTVVAFLDDFADPAVYMDLHALNRLMREGEVYSGAFLAVDESRRNDLYTYLKKTPKVAGVNVKQATLDNFRKILDENLLRMQLFNIGFASIIAFGVVYNSARISLSESSRDLATLRVMGFTRGEISMILLGELALLTLAAIPVGLCIGYAFAALLAVALDTESQRIPLIVSSRTCAFAVTVTLIAALITGLIVRRRLDQLDLVSVLKARE